MKINIPFTKDEILALHGAIDDYRWIDDTEKKLKNIKSKLRYYESKIK